LLKIEPEIPHQASINSLGLIKRELKGVSERSWTK